MIISPNQIPIRALVEKYQDDGEGGVSALAGLLDVRPPYQREFVYKDDKRDAVINTILNNYPLNVMYFAVREDGTYEVMDGQQRIISICQYVTGDFSFQNRSFDNLPSDLQSKILDYELFVYECEGTPSEKLDWFRVINIAGEKLTEQELRNAVYHGPWVTEAKKWFSKTGGPAATEGDGYLAGTPIRQELLETAIRWICFEKGIEAPESYMDKVRKSSNIDELWDHFRAVLTWAKTSFPHLRKELKSQKWGELYTNFRSIDIKPDVAEQKIKHLLLDDEVTNKSGIYQFVLSGQERFLNLRAFTENQKTEKFELQSGRCAQPHISGHDAEDVFEMDQMEADHITPWSQGGKTTLDNCQMLCRDCNRRKGSS